MMEIDPRWLTSNVCALAEAIRDERDVQRLPILADALMDAGCDDEEFFAATISNGLNSLTGSLCTGK
jgi:hypothetical protein